MQENIDRYLGGQRTEEQLSKVTNRFMVVAQANEGGIDNIQIKSVLQAYTKAGKKSPNHFVATLIFSKGSWQREEEMNYSFNYDTWISI